MQYPLGDFSHPALVKPVHTQVAADTAADIHGVLITVAAVRAFPDELAIVLHDPDLTVKAALLAVIALGV